MGPGNISRLGYHITKSVALNFSLGYGAAELHLPVRYLDYLPITMAGPGFDVNFLSQPDWIRPQDQDFILAGVDGRITWAAGHVDFPP
jgi:hypothetical protein